MIYPEIVPVAHTSDIPEDTFGSAPEIRRTYAGGGGEAAQEAAVGFEGKEDGAG